MTSQQHCPGFEQNKALSSFQCKCPDCGWETEIFSDEIEKIKKCDKCGKELDKSMFTKLSGNQ